MGLHPQQKRTRMASNPRPNTPQTFALSMLCNEPEIQNVFPLMLITHQGNIGESRLVQNFPHYIFEHTGTIARILIALCSDGDTFHMPHTYI